MNVVAFCLYGANPKYTAGAIQNAKLMPSIYPEWQMSVWFDSDVPLATLHELQKLGVTLIEMDGGFKQRMFYRLLIHDIPGVNRYLVRDADSRISMRERRCVDEWMRSGQDLHSIHDHFYHQRPIQGGMFGVWRSKVSWDGNRSMRERIGHWADDDKWGRDEEFLQAEIWPLLSGSVCEHGTNPIQSSDGDPKAFIGEIYDQHGKPEHPEHREMKR